MTPEDNYRNYLLSVRPEDAVVAACARQGFTSDHAQLVEAICATRQIDWHDVYDRCVAHFVAPLVYMNLQKAECIRGRITPETTRQFQNCLASNMAQKKVVSRRIEQFFAYCNAQGIEAMLMKGALFDRTVYRQPWYTMSGDVDILLKHEIDAYTDEQHAEMGRMSAITPTIEVICARHHDVSMSVLPIQFDRIWEDAVIGNYEQQQAFFMSPKWMLMTACINACRKRFLRLKDFCDVVAIIEQYKDIDWPEFAELVRINRCANVVYAAFVATRKVLGYNLPTQAVQGLKLHPLRAKMISHLIENHFRHEIRPITEPRHTAGLDASLVLPYSTYTPSMCVRKLRSLARRRLTGKCAD